MNRVRNAAPSTAEAAVASPIIVATITTQARGRIPACERKITSRT